MISHSFSLPKDLNKCLKLKRLVDEELAHYRVIIKGLGPEAQGHYLHLIQFDLYEIRQMLISLSHIYTIYSSNMVMIITDTYGVPVINQKR